MSLSSSFTAELKNEAATTRKMLERIPAAEFGWKPHEKSMAFGRLAVHVAEMTGWIVETINKEELDFAGGDYKPFNPETTEELVTFFDAEVAKAMDALATASDEHLMQNWTLKNGGEVFFTMPRVAVLRSMCINHIIHHRGQLALYLRLKDIPVPAIYGPSADEQVF